MTALAGVELESLVSEPDALTIYYRSICIIDNGGVWISTHFFEYLD